MGEGVPSIASAIIVEDQPAVRAWLADRVRETFGAPAVTEAGTLRGAWSALAGQPGGFDLALVDLGLPDGSGIELITALSARFPATLAVVTTVYDDDAHLFDALAAGAGGYILKDAGGGELERSLRAVAQGRPALSPSVARRIISHFRDRPPAAAIDDVLTPRETEVLAWLGRGFTTRETAARLGLSDQTVASYVKIVYSKLNISGRAEAALEARRRNLV